MIWSKLKRVLDEMQADSVRGRLAIHITRYGPGFSTLMTRAWLTWDKTAFANFSTIEAWRCKHGMTAPASLSAQYGCADFLDAMVSYVHLPIEEAIISSDPLIKGVALFDRRVGKRRLREMALTESDPPFMQRCYTLRCTAEGIVI